MVSKRDKSQSASLCSTKSSCKFIDPVFPFVLHLTELRLHLLAHQMIRNWIRAICEQRKGITWFKVKIILNRAYV